jgi:hypothetical protein
MDKAELKRFMQFLRQKYGSDVPAVANREPATVKIPMFQRAAEDEAFPQMPAGMDPMAMQGMLGAQPMGGMGEMGMGVDPLGLMGGGMGGVQPQSAAPPMDPMAMMDPRLS